VLAAIVIAQFLCTSLWFAGNAVVDDLIRALDFPSNSVTFLTSSIQFGFIVGTLLYALLNIADRFSPSKVFFLSAALAALSNLPLALASLSFPASLGSRFFTGIFLAGIYPVGMKIAADHFDKSLGKSLGLLVGALVVGTAFPHLIRTYMGNLDYKTVIYTVSVLAICGGLIIGILVPDGPYRKPSQEVEFSKTFAAFQKPAFRGAAFGYFGHMWELYSFYAFLPAILAYYVAEKGIGLDISFWSFVVIAMGGLGCALSGVFSQRISPKLLATIALSISGLMCFLSPWLFGLSLPMIFLGVLMIWGLSVAADSPMFSTLVANNAIPELKGTALTLVNCIGFALTIISIQFLGWIMDHLDFRYVFLLLGIGPVFGILSLCWKST